MRRLKVYFDRVLVYDVDGDCFTDMRDLRRLGMAPGRRPERLGAFVM